MRYLLCILSLLVLALPFPAGAAELVLPDGQVFAFEVAGPWVFSEQAPEFLVAETVEHVKHELADQGREVPPEQVEAAVTKRLAANEGFVYNPQSRSVLLIDFSPLREDEGAPGRKTIARSARYAAQELESEEGVDQVDASTERAALPALTHAYRIDATYRMHEEPRRFLGIVGFRDPYWVYLYFTDTQKAPGDLAAMEQLLAGARMGDAR